MSIAHRHCEQSVKQSSLEIPGHSGLAKIHSADRLFRFARVPRRLRLFAMTGMLMLLNACILVEDFGTVWKESKPDFCLSKLGESLYYTEFRRDPGGKDMDTLVHGFSHGGAHYLLLKAEPDDAGGRMYRFDVRNGIFQRWRLNPAMRATFEKDYPHAPVDLSRDTVELKQLGADELKLLDAIAAQNDYWEIEDQALYNTLRNPLCRFDDRDLTKEE